MSLGTCRLCQGANAPYAKRKLWALGLSGEHAHLKCMLDFGPATATDAKWRAIEERDPPSVVLQYLSVIPMAVIVFLVMAAFWGNVDNHRPASPPAASEPMQMPQWWQDMKKRAREDAERKCEMGALQSSNARRYYQLCMQQEGYE